MKILIVDDSSAMRRVIKNSINKFYEADYLEAENGGEALDILKLETNIDFIVTDWLMPVIDGVQLTTFLKTNDKTKNIPVLMVTSKSSKTDIIHAIKSGVNDYIVKPVVPAHLEVKIKNLVTNIQSKKVSE